MISPLPVVCLAALSFLSTTLSAQEIRVDFDDSSLVQPPQAAFPFYTPGAGQLNQTVRWQSFVPGTAKGMPTTAMFVSRIGFQLAGRAKHTTFQLRAGANQLQQLTNRWSQNLPDQRVQFDGSGVEIQGGLDPQNTPINTWVEFELANPFVWTPGESVVVDLTTHLATTGVMLTTALGTGSIPRLVEHDYKGGATSSGSPEVGGGLKLRVVFSPLDRIVSVGVGCPGTGGQVPLLSSVGAPKIGNQVFGIRLDGSRPSANNALVFGVDLLSPQTVALGGGCRLWTTPLIFSFGTSDSFGRNLRLLPLTVSPNLAGEAIHTQWLIDDPASGSGTGLSLSNAGTVSLY